MLADLLIVARSQRSLFEYLKQDFEADPDVRVILDRRHGERRQRQDPPARERRKGDRRVRPALDEKLESIGFAIVEAK